MKFGQYELLERIAIGGMAEVYKGRVVGAEGFEKLVAIKRIQPDLIADERFVTMLLTEARIHSALSHRNIVQIHDLGISEEGEYFIVLEYVEGYDLRAVMESITAEGEIIPEALSLHIAAEVAQGLHFAHELRGPDRQPLGLIHRDVSPSNVLISFAGEVKLSDFGLAKRRHDRSVVGSLKGNLIYMSPEQARQAPLDRRTDVFSLGALLFELLTGKRLREITDEIKGWGEVAAGVVRSARSVRPDLPASFEALLNQALAAEPGRRFPDAGTFGAAIRQQLAQMNTPVGPADLQALLSVVRPPKRPRGELERSKVIRLGPDVNMTRAGGAPLATSAPMRPAPAATAPSPLERLRANPGSATSTTSPAWQVAPATPGPAAQPPDDIDSFPPTPPPLGAPAPGPAGALGLPRKPAGPPLRGAAPTAAHSATTASPAAATPPPAAPLPPRRPLSAPLTSPQGVPPKSAPNSPHNTWAGGFSLSNGPVTAGARGPSISTTMRGPVPSLQGAEARPAPPSPGVTPPGPLGLRPRTGNLSSLRQPPPRALSSGPDVASVATPGPTPPPEAPLPPTPLPINTPLISAQSIDWTSRPTPPPAGAPPSSWAPSGAPTALGPGLSIEDRATPAPAVPSQRESAPSAPTWQPMQGSGALQAMEESPPPRETRRPMPLVLPIGVWRWVAVGLAGLLVMVAFIVHVGVMPLEVLVSWNKPALLYVASEPEGGIAKLDGVRLIDLTPSKIPVTRDRIDHLLEVEYPGYRPARETVRFDRSVALSFMLTLEKNDTAPILPVSGEAPPGATADK